MGRDNAEPLTEQIIEALEEYDRRKCARAGHDWQILNWIGIGQTRTCKRCGYRDGLLTVLADGRRQMHDGTILPPAPEPRRPWE